MASPSLLLILAVVGCRKADDTGGDDTGNDANTVPSTLAIDAIDGALPLPFAVDASGDGTQEIGAIDFTDDVGTIAYDSAPVGTFVYRWIPWGDLNLFQGFAITESSWDVFWLYCQASTLVNLWDEGVGGPAIHGLGASGDCTRVDAPVSAAIDMPALTLDLPEPPQGFAMEGPDVEVGTDGRGALRVGDAMLPLAVFEVVDCSFGCGTPGWYELHSIVWDDAASRAIFAILYLFPDAPEYDEVAYALSIPDLDDPIGDHALEVDSSEAPTNSRHVPGHGVPPPFLAGSR